MTDIKFLEMADKVFCRMECTILEFNSTNYAVLVHCDETDSLILFRYDYLDDEWVAIKSAPNTNEGFQYMMDLYQMYITWYRDYKKR